MGNALPGIKASGNNLVKRRVRFGACGSHERRHRFKVITCEPIGSGDVRFTDTGNKESSPKVNFSHMNGLYSL